MRRLPERVQTRAPVLPQRFEGWWPHVADGFSWVSRSRFALPVTGVLTSLPLTQVFLFAASPFAVTAGLAGDLVLLGLVDADLARWRRARG